MFLLPGLWHGIQAESLKGLANHVIIRHDIATLGEP
jgi:hypothetical protein